MCRTAQSTQLRDYFPILTFYLFLGLYYFFLDRFLPFPIYRALGNWGVGVFGLSPILVLVLELLWKIGRIRVFFVFFAIQDHGILLLFYVYDEV